MDAWATTMRVETTAFFEGETAAIRVNPAAFVSGGCARDRSAGTIRVDDASRIAPEAHDDVQGQAEGAGYLTASGLTPDRRCSERCYEEKNEYDAIRVRAAHGVLSGRRLWNGR